MPFKNAVMLLLAAFVCAKCNSGAEKEKQEPVVKVPKKDTVVKEEPVSNPFNDVSTILSGMGPEACKLNYLYDSAAWGTHKTFINESWLKLKESRLLLMEAWTQKELGDANKTCETVFYPFSGPDFLTANAFFPGAKQVIMLGLEPVGALPELAKLSNAAAQDYSDDFKHSLTDIFEKSYFITQFMLRDFQKQKVNGVLPVLCFFIRKTDHQILDIKYLERKGQDSILEKNYSAAVKPFGVKVTCRKDGITKTVYYFKYDVSNKQFNDTCVFYRFINERTPHAVTYLKSASYLLHAGFMSNMRTLILKNSDHVLQDDTGIPYNYFEEDSTWTIRLYGQYVKPVKNFPYLRMQKGILKAFQKDSAAIPPLPFHLGYHWESNKDLLIYAAKKK